jgi:hypothetical protein
MRWPRALFLVAGVISATVVQAAPLNVRYGQPIHIALAGKREAAVALRAVAGGWKLDLGGPIGVLHLRDVTNGAPPYATELTIGRSAVLLDPARFRADHAYHIELRQGEKVLGTAFIYLKPPRSPRGPIRFDDRDANVADDPELKTINKGSL